MIGLHQPILLHESSIFLVASDQYHLQNSALTQSPFGYHLAYHDITICDSSQTSDIGGHSMKDIECPSWISDEKICFVFVLFPLNGNG